MGNLPFFSDLLLHRYKTNNAGYLASKLWKASLVPIDENLIIHDIDIMHFEKRIPLILELGFRKDALPQLKNFIDLLWKTNEELNLVSRKMTFEELIDNHIIDCLLPLLSFPKKVSSVADFGTGGGLPGILYAIQFPNVHFGLYEKSNKKQDFLKLCIPFAKNINIHGEIPLKLTGTDLILARGFKPIAVILDISRSYYENNGKYFLLKARLEKINEELLLAKKKFKNLTSTLQVLKSPVLDVERHLVLIN